MVFINFLKNHIWKQVAPAMEETAATLVVLFITIIIYSFPQLLNLLEHKKCLLVISEFAIWSNPTAKSL